MKFFRLILIFPSYIFFLFFLFFNFYPFILRVNWIGYMEWVLSIQYKDLNVCSSPATSIGEKGFSFDWAAAVSHMSLPWAWWRDTTVYHSKYSVLLCICSWWFIERYLAADSVWNLSSARWKRQRDCYWWHILYWSSKLMLISLNFKQKICSLFSICNAIQHYLWMLNMRLYWWQVSVL